MQIMISNYFGKIRQRNNNLREYAALVLSGISKQASTILEHIDSTSEGSFERDALLTDTF